MSQIFDSHGSAGTLAAAVPSQCGLVSATLAETGRLPHREDRQLKNRWLIALAAVGIHLSIGSIYAYSVLKIPLFDHYGWAYAVK